MRYGRVFQDKLVYRANRHVGNIYFAHEYVAHNANQCFS